MPVDRSVPRIARRAEKTQRKVLEDDWFARNAICVVWTRLELIFCLGEDGKAMGDGRSFVLGLKDSLCCGRLVAFGQSTLPSVCEKDRLTSLGRYSGRPALLSKQGP
jgi:hypothetical protein